jgi:Mg2+/citrate symporter
VSQKAKQGNATQRNATQRNATQRKQAKQSKAKQSKAKQRKTSRWLVVDMVLVLVQVLEESLMIHLHVVFMRDAGMTTPKLRKKLRTRFQARLKTEKSCTQIAKRQG